jgi:hypothetical protein
VPRWSYWWFCSGNGNSKSRRSISMIMMPWRKHINRVYLSLRMPLSSWRFLSHGLVIKHIVSLKMLRLESMLKLPICKRLMEQNGGSKSASLKVWYRRRVALLRQKSARSSTTSYSLTRFTCSWNHSKKRWKPPLNSQMKNKLN